ncbi:hypothetical protein OHB13_19240 [Streptomyces sp. NBC_00440]|uniref:hypothetical protein n=1 Tax=unclassified Streptomyces TaxID=2593676 RepID=UPI00224F1D02|nr:MULTISPECIES: hypothetical protein [unclassified Streptomyces]MCX4725115.1 hypothetical protein [Streptomyces sp. NBC_01306]
MTDDGAGGLGGLRPGPAAPEGPRPEGRPPERYPPGRRVRSFFAVLLIVVAGILTPVSAVAVWTRDVVGDTDRYVALMRPLASDPAVQSAVTDRATEAIVKYVSVDALLKSVGPAERAEIELAIGALNKPIASGLKELVHSAVAGFVDSDAFTDVWAQLNRTAHTAAEKALTSDRGSALTIDLAPVTDAAKKQLTDSGLTIASKIPTVHTRYTVLDSQAVGRARTAFRLLRIGGLWLPMVTVLLAAGGVLLAVRRRRALVTAGLAVAAGALLLGLALAVFRSLYLDRLPADIPEPAAAAVINALTAFLRTAVRMIAVVGAVLALAAWLGGSGRVAVRVRTVWRGTIGAVRDAMGLRTGRAGLWVLRARTWLNATVVTVALAVYLVWDRPTAGVAVGIALSVLVALALVELAADDGTPRRPAEV